MAVDDHGLEVLKKSGEYVTDGDKSDYFIKSESNSLFQDSILTDESNVVLTDENGEVLFYPFIQKVELLTKNELIKVDIEEIDSEAFNLDASSRIRVSNAVPLFNSKNVMTKNSGLWLEETSGSGSISYDQDNSSVTLSVGTAAGDIAIRQSRYRTPYISGQSHLIMLTALLGPMKSGNETKIGYFDENDGLFFERDEFEVECVVMSSTSGTPIETKYPQYIWNLDKLDGTGKSGLTIDFDMAQIFVIDFLWLSLGRIRFGFQIDGKIVHCHEVTNLNGLTGPYMKTASLPVRYQIENTAATASASSMSEICSAVFTEGGNRPEGHNFSTIMTAARAVTTRQPVMAIRLKNSYNGVENRMMAKIDEIFTYVTTNDAIFELVHSHTPSSITATWSDVGSDSAIEWSQDISAITDTDMHTIKSFPNVAGNGNTAQISSTTTGDLSTHSILCQNFDSTNSEMFIVYATSLSGTANVLASLTWKEFF